MITEKSSTNSFVEKEKLNSRLKLVKHYIANSNFSSVLNNKKWKDLFYIIESNCLYFEIKLILIDKPFEVNDIFELEENSMITDNIQMGIVNFFEIETIIIDLNNEVISFLKERHIPYSDRNSKLELSGYIKS